MLHTLYGANSGNAGAITFTATDSYAVFYVKQGNVA
jgi:hypothetical protein